MLSRCRIDPQTLEQVLTCVSRFIVAALMPADDNEHRQGLGHIVAKRRTLNSRLLQMSTLLSYCQWKTCQRINCGVRAGCHLERDDIKEQLLQAVAALPQLWRQRRRRGLRLRAAQPQVLTQNREVAGAAVQWSMLMHQRICGRKGRRGCIFSASHASSLSLSLTCARFQLQATAASPDRMNTTWYILRQRVLVSSCLIYARASAAQRYQTTSEGARASVVFT